MYKKREAVHAKFLFCLSKPQNFSVLPDVVVVLFNLPNVEIEWKLSVPEQLLILNDRYNFSFDNEAIGTRLLMTFSVLFIFPFFFFEECQMGSITESRL